MKLLSRSFFVLASLFSLFSCRTVQLNPTYQVVPDDSAYKMPLSVIALPVTINYKTLKQKIHSSFSDVLYEDLSFDNNNTDQIMLRITRKDTIDIGTADNRLQLDAPLHVWLVYRFRTRMLGLPVEQLIEKQFDAHVRITSLIQLNAQWQIVSQTQTDIDTRLLPQIDIAGLVIDINKIFEPAIHAQEKRISKLIDEGLPTWINIKPLAMQQWQALQKPIFLDSAYKAWLIIQPNYITLSQIRYEKNAAVFGLSFLMNAELRTSEQVPVAKDKTLPPLQFTKGSNSGFNIYMPVRLFYTQLSDALNKQLVGKWYTFEQDKHRLFVEQIEVFPENGKLGIRLLFHGVSGKGLFSKKLKGTLIFYCVPEYDRIAKTLFFRKVEYAVQTKDVLLKSASWLLNAGLFKQSIEQKLNLPLERQLMQLQQLADKAINTQLAKNIYLYGNVQAVDIEEVQLLQQSLIVYLRAKGNANLDFK
jgi:hypothetical protein